MTALPNRAVVISGVRTGMGRSLALQAIGREYLVFGCSSSPVEKLKDDPQLAPYLENGRFRYTQADVSDYDQVQRFYKDYSDIVRGETIEELNVIANAGIAKWGDPTKGKVRAGLERMRRVNIDGTKYLARAFSADMLHAKHGRFVAMSSIVAAEGRAIAGNIHYQGTKIEAQSFATVDVPDDPDFAGVDSFAVAPGVIPTPMIFEEAIIPLVFRALMIDIEQNETLRAGLEAFIGHELIGSAPADRLYLSIQSILNQLDPKKEERVRTALKNDANLEGRGQQRFGLLVKSEKSLQEWVIQALYALDLAVSPEGVAERILDQFWDNRIPEQGVLKVYSSSGEDPILGLLKYL